MRYDSEMCDSAKAIIDKLNVEKKMLKKEIKEMQKLNDMDYEGTDKVKELKRELKNILKGPNPDFFFLT